MLETISTSSIVSTREGLLRGTFVDGVHIFRGVPYAAAPFGANRLRAPQPVQPWVGVRDAIQEGALPLQAPPPGIATDGPTLPSGLAVPGNDCLNLNVWTPEVGPARLPVMIWITGGMFEVGAAGWYDGSRFARDGVVCVAINYRVGAEGFAYFPGAIPNRGLLDQVAAMEWVRANVAAFGGDPDNVTICGESAGAMSIGTLLAVPRAAGLFRRAILESGAAHHVLPLARARQIGEQLAGKLGVSFSRDAIAALPPERLLEAQLALKAEIMASPDPERWGIEIVASILPFQPVVDGDVLPAAPLARVRAGASADVDLMVGTNADDWRLFTVMNGFERITPSVLTGDVAQHGFRSAAAYGLPLDRALAAYRAATGSAAPGDLLAAIQTDWWCRIPAIRLADAHVGSGSRTYMYEFAWKSPLAGGMFGSCHALEIPFVFDTLDGGPTQMLGNLLGDDPPQQLASAMHTAWISFMARGDPGWPEYELTHRTTMRFDTVSRTVDDPRATERALWQGVR